jgi:DNA-binding SARP family transcriptional activator
MIRISTLGGPELTDADGQVVKSLLSQPKRFALLFYLAAASPRGFQRRDTLAALHTTPEFRRINKQHPAPAT